MLGSEGVVRISHEDGYLTLYSEFATNGGEFYHGPGVSWSRARLCERIACVRAVHCFVLRNARKLTSAVYLLVHAGLACMWCDMFFCHAQVHGEGEGAYLCAAV